MVSHAGEAHRRHQRTKSASIDKDILSITDNGIGMTAGGQKYINQVAFSSAEEFIRNTKANQIKRLWSLWPWLLLIHGGAKVEIDTSYKEGELAVHWTRWFPRVP